MIGLGRSVEMLVDSAESVRRRRLYQPRIYSDLIVLGNASG